MLFLECDQILWGSKKYDRQESHVYSLVCFAVSKINANLIVTFLPRLLWVILFNLSSLFVYCAYVILLKDVKVNWLTPAKMFWINYCEHQNLYYSLSLMIFSTLKNNRLPNLMQIVIIVMFLPCFVLLKTRFLIKTKKKFLN